MIGLIWNCRGVSKKGMSTFIKELLYDYHVDFVGLQETIKKNYSDKFFRQIDPGKAFSWHWLPAFGTAGGILIGVKDSLMEIIGCQNFKSCFTVVIRNLVDKVVWRLGVVYGSPYEDGKQ